MNRNDVTFQLLGATDCGDNATEECEVPLLRHILQSKVSFVTFAQWVRRCISVLPIGMASNTRLSHSFMHEEVVSTNNKRFYKCYYEPHKGGENTPLLYNVASS